MLVVDFFFSQMNHQEYLPGKASLYGDKTPQISLALAEETKALYRSADALPIQAVSTYVVSIPSCWELTLPGEEDPEHPTWGARCLHREHFPQAPARRRMAVVPPAASPELHAFLPYPPAVFLTLF